jgi:putative endonuclease
MECIVSRETYKNGKYINLKAKVSRETMKKSEIGTIGENLACKLVAKHGYLILLRNYRKKFGEIDIIARLPDATLIFIEVKTLLMKYEGGLIPEDNFTTQKYKKVKRICEFFAARHPNLINEDRGWRLDLIAVYLFESGKYSMKHYENV